MKWIDIKNSEKFIADWAWSIAALVIMNTTLQLVIYPVLRAKLGIEEYGNVLYLVGIVNMIGTSVGCGMNNSRLKRSVYGKTNADIYNLFFLFSCIIFIPIALIMLIFNIEGLDFKNLLLFWLLICLTTCRNYADVEFRLSTNYKGYFKYYFSVTLGYGIGIIAFLMTNDWKLILLLGEVVSLFYLIKSRKKNNLLMDNAENDIREVFYSIILLTISQLIVNFVLNADRLVLKLFVSTTAVSVFYIASLLGKTVALITTPLNSVIIGYLAKKKTNMTIRTFGKIVGLTFIGAMIILGGCIIGSHVFVYLFYRKDYSIVKEYFIVANAASIVYFMSGIVTTILLRYTKEVFQIIINIIYCLIFILIIIPLTIKFSVWGFSYGLLIVNILRYILAVIIGVYYIDKNAL